MTNASTGPLTWTASNTQSWLHLSVAYESVMVGLFSWFYPGVGYKDYQLPGPILVGGPSDSFSSDSSFHVGISPADGASPFGMSTNVFHELAAQVRD